MGLKRHFKAYFVRGLAVLLPTILTIWLFVWGYRFIQTNISIYINRGLVWLILVAKGGNGLSKEQLVAFWVDGWGSLAGFLLGLMAVLVVGAILASVVGRTLWHAIENLIMGVPFLKRVYPYIKQFTDFFFAEANKGDLSFSKVVAVQYPRKGVWSIGIVTGRGLKCVEDAEGGQLLTIFIPNSPMPATGFTIMVAKEQVVDLDMTIEEVFRFVASVGVISPRSVVPAARPPVVGRWALV